MTRGSTVIEGQDDMKRAPLTRADVAERLGVSISTVRRFEGSRLHPVISDKGVRRFKPEDVERLAAALAAEQNTPIRIEKAAIRASELPKGELAALVFERLPMRRTEQDVVRRVTCEQLASMLAALPEKQPTRISLARALGDYFISDDKEEFSTSFAEYRNLAELGGFVV